MRSENPGAPGRGDPPLPPPCSRLLRSVGVLTARAGRYLIRFIYFSLKMSRFWLRFHGEQINPAPGCEHTRGTGVTPTAPSLLPQRLHQPWGGGGKGRRTPPMPLVLPLAPDPLAPDRALPDPLSVPRGVGPGGGTGWGGGRNPAPTRPGLPLPLWGCTGGVTRNIFYYYYYYFSFFPSSLSNPTSNFCLLSLTQLRNLQLPPTCFWLMPVLLLGVLPRP